MYQRSQIQFVKRKDYYDVIVYYSRNGDRFRPSTWVKLLPKHLTKSGTISSAHPNLEEDLRRIKDVQDRVENLVASYKDRYGEKPAAQWLESEFVKPIMKPRTDLEDLLTYWDEYIEEKNQTVRSKKTVDRINNVRHTLKEFSKKKK